MTTIGIRELKAKTGQVLRAVSENHKEFLITNHGRPAAKLVPIDADTLGEKKSSKALRGAFSHLPDLDDAQFKALKQVWKTDQ